MMHLLGLQIYLWSCVTLIFDPQTPKVDHFMPLSHGPLMLFGINFSSFVFKLSRSHVW